MPQPDRENDSSLCDIEWVHVFERDTKAGAVFRPANTDIPLSRRPREHLVLHRDGSGVIRLGGADDRLADRAARWSKEGGDIVLRETGGSLTWRIVDHSKGQLLVRMD